MQRFRRLRSDIGVAISWFGGVLLAGMTCSAPLASTGCACTLAYHTEGLLIRLSPSPMPDGVYHFEVIADGEPIGVVAEVAGGAVTCDPEGGCQAEVELDDDRRLFLDVGTWGDALNVYYSGEGPGPFEAIVTITRDDAALTSAVFTPEYEHSEPNGPGCGDTWFAEAEMVLP
jgi:hypothetical protein